MKLMPRSVFRAVFFIIQALCISARADTDALCFPASTNTHAVGFLNNGVGWLFVPTTNLIVTWVGFENLYTPTGWIVNVRITFWTSTNTPVVTYSSDYFASPAEMDTNNIIYGKVGPLFLSAGHEYFVTLDLGLNTAVVVEEYTTDFSDLRPFRSAPELTYLGGYDYDVAGGSLTPNSPGLLLGPTFRFQVASEASPRLEIKATRNAVVLAWPTNAPSCFVETAQSPTATIWEQVSNAPVVLSERYFLTNQPSDLTRFFRLRLQ